MYARVSALMSNANPKPYKPMVTSIRNKISDCKVRHGCAHRVSGREVPGPYTN